MTSSVWWLFLRDCFVQVEDRCTSLWLCCSANCSSFRSRLWTLKVALCVLQLTVYASWHSACSLSAVRYWLTWSLVTHWFCMFRRYLKARFSWNTSSLNCEHLGLIALHRHSGYFIFVSYISCKTWKLSSVISDWAVNHIRTTCFVDLYSLNFSFTIRGICLRYIGLERD